MIFFPTLIFHKHKIMKSTILFLSLISTLHYLSFPYHSFITRFPLPLTFSVTISSPSLRFLHTSFSYASTLPFLFYSSVFLSLSLHHMRMRLVERGRRQEGSLGDGYTHSKGVGEAWWEVYVGVIGGGGVRDEMEEI